MIDTGTDDVRAWIEEGVGIVELNRPDRRNALSRGMYDGVPRVLEQFEGDDAVGVILVTGAGPSFCAGGDVKGGRGRPAGGAAPEPVDEDALVASRAAALTADARMIPLLHGSAKLTMAALPGPAVGAGMAIALAADLRIAAASARLIGGWADLGFTGDFGGPWLLTRLLGPSRALEVLVDGTPIDAERALGLGLVNRVVPDAELREQAVAWATRLAAGPRGAHRGMKQNVRDAVRLELADALPRESERMVRSGLTEEHRQAVARWLAAAEARRASR